MLTSILAVLILAMPLLIFANVWYSFKYYQLERQVDDLEARQGELIERNKRLITGISILRSPARIIQTAREMGMEMAHQDQLQIVSDDS